MTHLLAEEPDLEILGMKWNPRDDGESGNETSRIQSIEDIEPVRSYAAQPIDFVVEGMIAAGTVTAITGDSGCGKSTLATAIFAAVEKGVPFAGFVTKRRPVLVLDRENPGDVVVERMDRLGITDGPNFKVWGGWCPDAPPSPWSPIVVDFVTRITPTPLILVDSFIAFYEGDENDASQMRSFMRRIRRLADLGATVVVLHHSGRNDSEYRGSSDFKASLDIGYKVTNLGEPSRLSRLRMKAFKTRFPVSSELVLHYRHGEFQTDQTDRQPESEGDEEILKAILTSSPGITRADFEDAAATRRVRRNRARNFLNGAIAGRQVEIEVGLHNAHHHRWIGSR